MLASPDQFQQPAEISLKQRPMMATEVPQIIASRARSGRQVSQLRIKGDLPLDLVGTVEPDCITVDQQAKQNPRLPRRQPFATSTLRILIHGVQCLEEQPEQALVTKRLTQIFRQTRGLSRIGLLSLMLDSRSSILGSHREVTEQ